MKKLITLLLLVSFVLLTACTAGPNSLVNVAAADGAVAGFWLGLWHGFIVLFTFIAALFRDDVGIYAINNNGGWYDFGYLLGVMMFWSGGQHGGQKAYWKKKCLEQDAAKEGSEVEVVAEAADEAGED